MWNKKVKDLSKEKNYRILRVKISESKMIKSYKQEKCVCIYFWRWGDDEKICATPQNVIFEKCVINLYQSFRMKSFILTAALSSNLLGCTGSQPMPPPEPWSDWIIQACAQPKPTKIQGVESDRFRVRPDPSYGPTNLESPSSPCYDIVKIIFIINHLHIRQHNTAIFVQMLLHALALPQLSSLVMYFLE